MKDKHAKKKRQTTTTNRKNTNQGIDVQEKKMESQIINIVVPR